MVQRMSIDLNVNLENQFLELQKWYSPHSTSFATPVHPIASQKLPVPIDLLGRTTIRFQLEKRPTGVMGDSLSANIDRVKEVMGDTFSDAVIGKALTTNENNFEKALNYLLEGGHSEPDASATDELRQSLSDALTTTSTSTLEKDSWGNAEGWGEPFLKLKDSPVLDTELSKTPDDLPYAELIVFSHRDHDFDSLNVMVLFA